MSVDSWLRSLPRLKTAPGHLWSELLRNKGLEADYDLYSGHFYFPLNNYVRGKLDVIVILRDPIARTISHFEHVRRSPDHYFHERVASKNSLIDFVESPETRPLIANFQARCLVEPFDPVRLSNSLPLSAQPYALERVIETRPMTLSLTEALAAGKRYLDRAACVGVTDRLDEFCANVSARFGLARPARTPHINVASAPSRTKESLASEELSAIEDATRIDRQLFEYARYISAAAVHLPDSI